MMEIRIKKKLMGSEGLLDLDIAISEEEGIFMSMLGPSGSGKTSILRMICGLMRPDEGLIKFGDEVWYDSRRNIDLKPQLRDVGIVFQDYGLFPNMTTSGNLKFAQGRGGMPEEVSDMLETMGLQALADQPITKLSGGQQQRLALGRTLIQRPSLLLLDEPLSATDSVMREELRDMMIKLHHERNLTTILVSHDRHEILQMATKIYELHNGHVVKKGRPLDVLYKAATKAGKSRTKVWDLLDEGGERYAVIKINDGIFQIRVTKEVQIGDEISINFQANS